MYPLCWRALQHLPHLFVINCFYELFDYRFLLTMVADWYLGMPVWFGWCNTLSGLNIATTVWWIALNGNLVPTFMLPTALTLKLPLRASLNDSPGDLFDQLLVSPEEAPRSWGATTKIQIRTKKHLFCLWLNNVGKMWNKLRCTQTWLSLWVLFTFAKGSNNSADSVTAACLLSDKEKLQAQRRVVSAVVAERC